ncbi:hypothetical protein ACS0TY_017105 [Phlomoides rotata]
MSSGKQVEIQFEDPNPQKWCHPLKEDVFARLMSKENPLVYKAGSLFSPFLFGKFFDPSDAFPLWEFESDVLLPSSNSNTQRNLDWYQTDTDYVLKAEIPGSNSSVQVIVENGKILEISGQWKQHKDSRKKDWRSSHWWEEGYVRRIELPDQQTDWTKSEAHFKNDQLLEIRIPKNPTNSDTTQLNK